MQVLTTNQAADELNVSPDTVRRWIDDGKLAAQRVGRNWAVAKADVMRRKRLALVRAAHERVRERA